MKTLERAPQLIDVSDSDIKKIVDLSMSGGISNLLKKANSEYLYWDKFKYMIFPESVSKELAWLCLRIIRNGQIKRIPMKDKTGECFGYWQPDEILRILHYIDQNASGQILVEDPRVHSGARDRYLISSIMEEAIASSQLEGAATTRKKAKEMLRSGRKPENKAEQMCYNNYITISRIKDLIRKPLSKELIIEMQASITKDTLEDPSAEGRFRTEKEQIQVVDDSDGQILYVPPSADEIEERIKVLCNFANNPDEEVFVHPVVKAIILHFWLAYIHPFVDGNGRTARALFYWYMLKNKYWLFEYLSISRILVRAPGQYKRAYLYSEIDNLDLTYFLGFNLKTINLAIKGLHAYLAKQQEELKESEQFIKKYPNLNHRQYEILYHAVSHPDAMYTIKFLRNTYNTAYQTARTDLMDLQKKGFLEKEKKNKEFIFIPAKNIHKKLRGLRK